MLRVQESTDYSPTALRTAKTNYSFKEVTEHKHIKRIEGAEFSLCAMYQDFHLKLGASHQKDSRQNRQNRNANR